MHKASVLNPPEAESGILAKAGAKHALWIHKDRKKIGKRIALLIEMV